MNQLSLLIGGNPFSNEAAMIQHPYLFMLLTTVALLTGGPAKPAGPGGPTSPRSPLREKKKVYEEKK